MATGKPIPAYPPGGCNFSNLTAIGNNLLKTGPGILFSASVNTGAASATMTIYDGINAGGTKLGTFSAAASAPNPIPQVGIQFNTGLFIVIAGAAPDITIGWF